MGDCHCRDCRRATGRAFAAAILVSTNGVKITGEVKYHEVIGDSGAIVAFARIVARGCSANRLRRRTSQTL
jgi:hypothetical protein